MINLITIIACVFNFLLLVSLIICIKIHRSTTKILNQNNERIDKINRGIDVLVEKNKKNKETIDNNIERLNHLSKENYKVREENEILKDRLRNIGINDFDVI